ncbi:response regulator, partial [Streptomyces sp. MBT49]|uniref:LuxR C-terminal-related transcriptional regulator n=1 Tax=Streptomyces sp. MBT49 TaxID=1488380 RepID=UPI00190A4892
LVRLLEAYDFEIAAAVESGPELERALTELEPDVAVVDVRLPPTHTDEGLQCALRARGRRPGLPVLVLSQHVEQLYARELLADGTGGIGYLLKDRVFDEREVMELMAQGRSNAAIAGKLVVTERAVAKHTANIFVKLGLEVSDDDNRRVLAVLAYLDRDR